MVLLPKVLWGRSDSTPEPPSLLFWYWRMFHQYKHPPLPHVLVCRWLSHCCMVFYFVPSNWSTSPLIPNFLVYSVPSTIVYLPRYLLQGWYGYCPSRGPGSMWSTAISPGICVIHKFTAGSPPCIPWVYLYSSTSPWTYGTHPRGPGLISDQRPPSGHGIVIQTVLTKPSTASSRHKFLECLCIFCSHCYCACST